jgi:transcription initiation factor TFIIH subunit 2
MSTALAAPTSTSDDAKEIHAHKWEAIDDQETWKNAVQEDASGRIVVAANGETFAQAIRQRRKRLETNDAAQRNRRVVRDMIRYVYVLVDASRWMRQKDVVLGHRVETTVQMLRQFVDEYYDQNPLSQLGFIVIKHGEAEILTQLSSSGGTHKLALTSLGQLCAREGPHGGEFSLQNGLEVAGRSLGHQPRHGSREILVVTAALSTSDPGYLLTETLPKLQRAKIRVSCFALSAEMHICRKLADETSGTMGVCLDRSHFRDWLFGQCVPPPALRTSTNSELLCEMIAMGFPTRTSEAPSLVHASREKTILARMAYICPQCQAKNSELPTDCAICGLKLVLAPHLARSFHHLFPVKPFVERQVQQFSFLAADKDLIAIGSAPHVTSSGSIVPTEQLNSKLLVSSAEDDRCCYACLRPLGFTTNPNFGGTISVEEEMLRFECPECSNSFCVDCDAYLHGALHNCPGCLRRD